MYRPLAAPRSVADRRTRPLRRRARPIVEDVRAGSAAQRAGIVPGHEIVAINGTPVAVDRRASPLRCPPTSLRPDPAARDFALRAGARRAATMRTRYSTSPCAPDGSERDGHVRGEPASHWRARTLRVRQDDGVGDRAASTTRWANGSNSCATSTPQLAAAAPRCPRHGARPHRHAERRQLDRGARRPRPLRRPSSSPTSATNSSPRRSVPACAGTGSNTSHRDRRGLQYRSWCWSARGPAAWAKGSQSASTLRPVPWSSAGRWRSSLVRSMNSCCRTRALSCASPRSSCSTSTARRARRSCPARRASPRVDARPRRARARLRGTRGRRARRRAGRGAARERPPWRG